MNVVRLTLAGIVTSVALACARGAPPGAPAPSPQPLPQTLPAIPVYEITPRTDTREAVMSRNVARDPFALLATSKRVTLASSNADARTLLLWLARQADLNLVISQDVQARVSVNFRDVPAIDAMRAVIAEAGLSILVGEPGSPWPPVVFYQLPVNINQVSAEAIAARFGLSLELARWIVENRPRP